jgi:C4-dicarboxylate transporter DctM subunit
MMIKICHGILFKKTSQVIDNLSAIFGNLSMILVLIMGLSVVYEIFTRTFLNQPSRWTLEFATYFTTAATLLGAAYVATKERHICVDIITCRLRPKSRGVVEFWTYICALIFLALFVYSALKFLSMAGLTRAVSTTLQIPLYFPQSVVFLGSLLLSIQLIKIITNKGRILVDEKKNLASEATVARSIFSTCINFVDKPAALFLLLFAALVTAGGYLMITGLENLTVIGLIVLILTFLLSGMPIFLGLISIASIGSFLLISGGLSSQLGLAQAGYGALDKFELSAIPLFILGGSVLGKGKLTDKLLDLFQSFTSYLPAPLAIASILSCAAFGAMCGSGISGALTIGIIAVPAMVARGYGKELAFGSVASAGTLAILIPPSIPMIVIASLTDVSVAQLFAGGILPGLLITGLLSAYVFLRCRNDPRYRSTQRSSKKEKVQALKASIPVLMIPIALVGTIYTGAATPTEAAAAFALYATILSIIYGELRLSNFWQTLRDSLLVCSALLMIFMAAGILNIIVVRIHAPQIIASWALNAQLPPWAIIVIINLALIVAGMIFESAAITVILTPILFPVVISLGYNPLWFGILFVINTEIAQISPPVGIVLYALQGAVGEKLGIGMDSAMKAVLPFMVILMIGLLIVGLFEPISTWLPSILLK